MIPFALAALPWGRILAGAALVAVVYGAHAMYSGHYRDQGRGEVQAEWDAQKIKDHKAILSSITAARIAERQLVEAAAVSAEKRIGELSNENNALRDSLAKLPAGRLRTVTVYADPTSPAPGQSDRPGDHAACTVRLPAEIGEGFQRLYAESIRIGSEANATAITLAACQERVRQLEGFCR